MAHFWALLFNKCRLEICVNREIATTVHNDKEEKNKYVHKKRNFFQPIFAGILHAEKLKRAAVCRGMTASVRLISRRRSLDFLRGPR